MTTIQPTSAICPRSSEAAGLLPASWSTCCVLRPISANCRQSNEVARLPQTDVRLKDVYGSVVWIGVVRRQATDHGNAEYRSFPDGFASTQICPHQRQNSYRSLIHAARLRSRRLLKPGSVKRLAKAPLEFEWRTFRLFRRPARRRHENPYGRGMVSVLLSHLVEIEFDKCFIWLLMNVTH